MTTTTDILVGLNGFVAWKPPVKAATTANITLSGAQTIDGVSVTAGDRVLVKDQSTPSENGIYVVSATEWTRATDFNGSRDVRQGTQVRVTTGTVSGNSTYEITTADPITIGTTSIAFAFAGVVQGADYVELTGNQTIAGTKTFSSAIVGDLVGDVTGNVAATTITATTVTSDLVGDVTGDLTGDVTTLTTRGDLLYQGAAADARLAVGTANQFLTTDGTDPSWGSPMTWSGVVDLTNGGADDLNEIDVTGIPAEAKQIVITVSDLSLTGTDVPTLRIGTSGGIEATGYDSIVARVIAASTTNATASFVLAAVSGATSVWHGTVTLSRIDGSSNHWVSHSVFALTASNVSVGGGDKTLSGTLDRIRLTTNGTDTYDGGTMNVGWIL